MIEFIRHIIFRDFWLKLMSVGFAVIIWFSISKIFMGRDIAWGGFSPHTTEQTFANVPVLVVLPAAEMRTITVQPTVVQVTVRGEPEAIQKLRWDQISAQINLTGIESATALSKRVEIQLPTGLVPTRIIPDEVEVTIPRR
jgi:YbbR domain-containing protein